MKGCYRKGSDVREKARIVGFLRKLGADSPWSGAFSLVARLIELGDHWSPHSACECGDGVHIDGCPWEDEDE